MVEPNIPNENPHRLTVLAAVQVAIAVVCGLWVGHVVDWPVAVHVFLAVLTFFTSANRATLVKRRCAHCGHRR